MLEILNARIMICLLVFIVSLASSANAGDAPFKIRGMKGLFWKGTDTYRRALPWLAEHKMNFLMLCYTSFPASGTDWRADYSPSEKDDIRSLTAEAKKLGIDVCLAFNPGLYSKPPLEYSSEQDYQSALSKVKAIHALGVKWFAFCLDDIYFKMQPADKERFGNLETAHVYFVSRLWNDMKRLAPRPKLIFCPTPYCTYVANKMPGYMRKMAEEIDPEIMMFWTGYGAYWETITTPEARKFGEMIGRKPILWDNFPANDSYNRRMILKPLSGRSADLCDAVAGYISNPMREMWNADKIPLATTMDYLNNPREYDPDKAREHMIKSYPADQQRAIRVLVDLYGDPSRAIPPEFKQPVLAVDAHAATKALPKYRALQKELSGNPGLRDLWAEVHTEIENDIAALEEMCNAK